MYNYEKRFLSLCVCIKIVNVNGDFIILLICFLEVQNISYVTSIKISLSYSLFMFGLRMNNIL